MTALNDTYDRFWFLLANYFLNDLNCFFADYVWLHALSLLLRRLGGLDDIFYFISALQWNCVSSFEWRDKFKEKLLLIIIFTNIWVNLWYFMYLLLEIKVLHTNLHLSLDVHRLSSNRTMNLDLEEWL